MKKTGPQRTLLRTVLLVGEGYAEVAFITHLKALYIFRGCGVALTVKNARGKGALHVVEVAVRQSRNFAFDVKAALLDTDTGWNEETRTLASKEDVLVVRCTPCLEAMLLALHGDAAEGRSSAQCKQVFAAKFAGAANEAHIYAKYFPPDLLQKARLHSPWLEQLLVLLKPA